jgi:hypothetical protein
MEAFCLVLISEEMEKTSTENNVAAKEKNSCIKN